MASYTDFFKGADTGINAVTAAGTTTGSSLDASMREIVSFVITATSISSGNAVLTVDGSDDGTNWVTGLAMTDATATAVTTYVTSKTQSSNASSAVYLGTNPFRFLRAKIVVTTDGTYTVTAHFKS